MKLKTIFVAILSAITAIILYKNNDPSSFWLFGDIYTSKLILLCIFYILGIITGALLFRRKSKYPQEYSINNTLVNVDEIPSVLNNSNTSVLSNDDKEFIRND